MATITGKPVGVMVERLCAQCRGHFVGQGYQKGGYYYCCDVCARRASGPGFTTLLTIAAALIGLGAYIAERR